MDPARWKQAQDVFHQAILLDDKDQRVFLDQACQGDPGLFELLERLLEEDRKISDQWEDELAQVAKGPSACRTAVLPAEDLGPYRFVRLLGQGGMGAVYQAEHRFTGQVVAVKVLRSGELSIASHERFATEQRALARLNHPSIARLYASERFRDGTPGFVMEYVEGEPLTIYCRNQGSSIRERILLFRQVCAAVQHAHEHAIIHRDLKPSNILVKHDGTVRLLDFGIAKQLDAQGNESSVTGIGVAPMSLGYAAPEQVSGGTVGTHTDVYALGVTLYELLTDRAPLDLEGLTPGEAETAIRFQNPERPSQLMQKGGLKHSFDTLRWKRTDWSDLDVLCGTAIHKDPARRYRSVEALIRDLDHWLQNQPLDARKDSFSYRLAKFVKRNRRSLAVAASLVVLITGLTIWFTVNLARARDAALEQQAKTQRVEKFVLSLFDNGDAVAGPSKSATALTMLDRGRQEAETLKNDRDFQTELYKVLGSLYGKLGRFEDANRLLQATLRNQALQGKERAENLITLGLLRTEESQFPEAEKLIRQGLQVMHRDKKATAGDVASTEAALGYVLVAEQKFQEAIPVLENALHKQVKAESAESEQAKTLIWLAQAQQEAANYPVSVSYNERALSIDRRLYGDFHPQVADDWESLGSLRQMQRRYLEAAADHKQALEIYEGWYGKEHPRTVEALVCLGQALALGGQSDPAREKLNEGIAIGRRVLGGKSALMALALNALATLEQKTEHFDAARANFEQAIVAARAVYGESSFNAAVNISNLATLEKQTKHYRKAERLYLEALKDFQVLLPPNHPNLGLVEMNLGETLWDEHRYPEARANLETAVAILRKSNDPPWKNLEKARALLEDIRRRQDASSQ